MPTAQYAPPVPRAPWPLRARFLERSSYQATRRSSVLALAFVWTACLDPHYPEDPAKAGNESVAGGSRGADASLPSSALRDGGGAPSRDAEPDSQELDGGPGTGFPGSGATTAGAPGDPGASATGSRPDAAVPDALPGAAVPAWALPLLGRYATRWFSFKQDEYGTVVRAEQLAIVEFALEGAGMTLRSKYCLTTGQSKLAELRLVDPSALPERLEQVRFSELERSWSSEGPTYAAGFTIEQPASCAGKQGQSLAKTPAQVWLTGGSCRCASPGEAPLVDDCRILDPDRDQKPGITYSLKGITSSLADATIFAATENDAHYVNGKVGVDGALPSANIALVDRNYQLGCEPAGCTNIAVLGKACPISFNHALFARLAAGTTTLCADLATNVNALFPTPVPDFPARCF